LMCYTEETFISTSVPYECIFAYVKLPS